MPKNNELQQLQPIIEQAIILARSCSVDSYRSKKV